MKKASNNNLSAFRKSTAVIDFYMAVIHKLISSVKDYGTAVAFDLNGRTVVPQTVKNGKGHPILVPVYRKCG